MPNRIRRNPRPFRCRSSPGRCRSEPGRCDWSRRRSGSPSPDCSQRCSRRECTCHRRNPHRFPSHSTRGRSMSARGSDGWRCCKRRWSNPWRSGSDHSSRNRGTHRRRNRYRFRCRSTCDRCRWRPDRRFRCKQSSCSRPEPGSRYRAHTPRTGRRNRSPSHPRSACCRSRSAWCSDCWCRCRSDSRGAAGTDRWERRPGRRRLRNRCPFRCRS